MLWKPEVPRTVSSSEWQSQSPGCYLSCWPTDYKSESPRAPSSGLINLLGRLREPRKTICSLDCWFIILIKGYRSVARWRHTGKVLDQRAMSLWVWGLARRPMEGHSPSLGSWKQDLSPPFWVFNGSFVPWLIIGQWPLIQPPAPLPSLEVHGGLRIPALSSQGWFSWPPALTLGWHPEPPSLKCLRNWGQGAEPYPMALITQEIPRVRELWARNCEWRPNVYFFSNKFEVSYHRFAGLGKEKNVAIAGVSSSLARGICQGRWPWVTFLVITSELVWGKIFKIYFWVISLFSGRCS